MGRKKLSSEPTERIVDQMPMPSEGMRQAEAARGQVQAMDRQHREAIKSAAQIQTHLGYHKLSGLAMISLFEEARATKSYLGLPYSDEQGNDLAVETLEQYCQHYLGKSYNFFQEHTQLLRSLGEVAYVSASELGFSRAQLRLVQQLPEADRQIVSDAMAAKDKDAVVDMLEALVTRKQALEKKIGGLEADAAAHAKLITNKNKKIDDLDRQIHDLRTHTKDWHPRAFEVCLEISEVGARILEATDRLQALRDTILTEDFGPEHLAAIDAMAVVYYDMIHQIIDVTDDLGAACQHHFLGYKEKARPLVNMAEVFGAYDKPA
jgi:hypothetical protein